MKRKKEKGTESAETATRKSLSAKVPSSREVRPQTGAASTAAEIPSFDGSSLEQQEGESSEAHRVRVSRIRGAQRRRELARLAEEPKPRRNPLLLLPEERRAKLFFWLRECPFHDAVKQMLADQELAEVTDGELDEFFEAEAMMHWQRRLQRAATEADALIRLVEENPVKFSNGILAALGQEAFRQIASGDVAPEAMARMTNLFLKARGDERAEQALALKRDDLERKWRERTELALESFAAELENHPEARAAFEALRLELQRGEGEAE